MEYDATKIFRLAPRTFPFRFFLVPFFNACIGAYTHDTAINYPLRECKYSAINRRELRSRRVFRPPSSRREGWIGGGEQFSNYNRSFDRSLAGRGERGGEKKGVQLERDSDGTLAGGGKYLSRRVNRKGGSSQPLERKDNACPRMRVYRRGCIEDGIIERSPQRSDEDPFQKGYLDEGQKCLWEPASL